MTPQIPTSAYRMPVDGDGAKLIWAVRVAPVLKEQISSGKINLIAIVNTHQ